MNWCDIYPRCLNRAGFNPSNTKGVVSLLVTFMSVVLANIAVAATDESRNIREIGEGRSFVIVQPNDAWQPAEFDGAMILRAAPVEQAPTIDGRLDDSAWSSAIELISPLAWGNVREVTLKAVYTEKDIFLAVSWSDPTMDDLHHPWTWDSVSGRYTEGPQIEDALLVSIEGGCDWNPSLLANQIYDFDAWVWMAARTNPLGQAVDADGNVQNQWIPDRGYVKYRSRHPDPTWNVKFIDSRDGILTRSWRELERMYKIVPPEQEVYVRYLPDGGHPSDFATRVSPPAEAVRPVNTGLGSTAQEAGSLTVPQYQPVRLTGDAGEVAAKGHWKDGRWTVEFGRALVTPARTSSDSLFERTTQFSIHIFDHVERLDQASESGRLYLQFEPKEEDQLPGATILVTR